MNFSSISTEIRLKIFSELLVLSEPIDFVADYLRRRPSFDAKGMGSVQLFSVLAE